MSKDQRRVLTNSVLMESVETGLYHTDAEATRARPVGHAPPPRGRSHTIIPQNMPRQSELLAGFKWMRIFLKLQHIFLLEQRHPLAKIGAALYSLGLLCLIGRQVFGLIHDDLEFPTIVAVSLIFIAYNTAVHLSFVIRFWGKPSWLYTTWWVVWSNEDALVRSERRYARLVPVSLAIILGASLIPWIRFYKGPYMRNPRQLFIEIFAFRVLAIDAVLSIGYIFLISTFVLPIMSFFDIMLTIKEELKALRVRVMEQPERSLEVAEEFAFLAKRVKVVNKVYGIWLSAVFGVLVPLCVVCFELLLRANIDVFTRLILFFWFALNASFAAATAVFAARIHAAAHKLEYALAVSLRSGDGSMQSQIQFVFFSTSLFAYNFGIKALQTVTITFKLIAKTVSLLASLFLLLAGAKNL
eukprot:c2260_g1_i1.p1 GENE.c2260_g1_i1~~c2260_g1_i1.p1  ORF type:complete len:484 (+),score=88.96 c2260_g1_i1:215-1453(+)